MSKHIIKYFNLYKVLHFHRENDFKMMTLMLNNTEDKILIIDYSNDKIAAQPSEDIFILARELIYNGFTVEI
jgi:hypothetical protein